MKNKNLKKLDYCALDNVNGGVIFYNEYFFYIVYKYDGKITYVPSGLGMSLPNAPQTVEDIKKFEQRLLNTPSINNDNAPICKDVTPEEGLAYLYSLGIGLDSKLIRLV